MEKIRKGDEVIILTGRDKARRGTVLSRVDADHVLVEGINVVKKHARPNPMAGAPGGIIEKTMPIHISNVALFNPATGKGERVGFKEVDGKKVRVFRSKGKETVVGAKA
jgi:large subunit ribosomal protein L24